MSYREGPKSNKIWTQGPNNIQQGPMSAPVVNGSQTPNPTHAGTHHARNSSAFRPLPESTTLKSRIACHRPSIDRSIEAWLAGLLSLCCAHLERFLSSSTSVFEEFMSIAVERGMVFGFSFTDVHNTFPSLLSTIRGA